MSIDVVSLSAISLTHISYMVIVKVGRPSERSKPGNRGKRDSQILLMHYLNRVHFDAPMTPLELEIYHQMRNVIGIDPAFYEYIFTVDADTVCALICYCGFLICYPDCHPRVPEQIGSMYS